MMKRLLARSLILSMDGDEGGGEKWRSRIPSGLSLVCEPLPVWPRQRGSQHASILAAAKRVNKYTGPN